MKVAFLFAGSRESRWDAALRGEAPSDFFYGAVEFARRGHEVLCVDAPERPRAALARVYNALFDACAPVRTRGEHVAAVGSVLPRLAGADVVVATSTSHALALGLWKRWGRFRGEIVGIHCGLVNFPVHGARLRATARLLAEQRIVLFAESERAKTLRQFGLPESAVHANAFGVDTDFWKPEGRPGGELLSVGNDGRRDYATLVEAARSLDAQLKIVTARELPLPLPPNVAHVRGSWHAPAMTDAGLRELYRAAFAVVVPLQDSIQPSGQSVALQAMACGRPVILSRTEGLWCGEDFRDGEEIVLVRHSSAEALRVAMRDLLSDAARAERIGAAARLATEKYGRIDDFAERLERIVNEAAAAASKGRK